MVQLIMLIGLPASGKSNFIRRLGKTGFIVHSSDDLREELYGDASIQTDNEALFRILHQRITSSLKNGESVIYDATNINSKKRKGFLKSIEHIKRTQDLYTTAIVFATTVERCIELNEKRKRKVPVEVIRRMWKGFNFPLYSEGWSTIKIEHPFYEKKNLESLLTEVNYFDQKNPNHSLSLGHHMIESYKHYPNEAALLHDIGKKYTQTFYNTKGELDTVAHYYGHENVSAYESMFYIDNNAEGISKIQLIQIHMLPYFIKDEEKLREKAGNLYEQLLKLHEADRKAH